MALPSPGAAFARFAEQAQQAESQGFGHGCAVHLDPQTGPKVVPVGANGLRYPKAAQHGSGHARVRHAAMAKDIESSYAACVAALATYPALTPFVRAMHVVVHGQDQKAAFFLSGHMLDDARSTRILTLQDACDAIDAAAAQRGPNRLMGFATHDLQFCGKVQAPTTAAGPLAQLLANGSGRPIPLFWAGATQTRHKLRPAQPDTPSGVNMAGAFTKLHAAVHKLPAGVRELMVLDTGDAPPTFEVALGSGNSFVLETLDDWAHAEGPSGQSWGHILKRAWVAFWAQAETVAPILAHRSAMAPRTLHAHENRTGWLPPVLGALGGMLGSPKSVCALRTIRPGALRAVHQGDGPLCIVPATSWKEAARAGSILMGTGVDHDRPFDVWDLES